MWFATPAPRRWSSSRSRCASLRAERVSALLLAAAALAADPPAVAAAAQRAPAWTRCVAGADPGAVLPFERLNALREKAEVEPVVRQVFEQREREQRLSGPNLATASISLDFLYAAGPAASRVYYYEASKAIPDAAALLRVSVAGWLRTEGGRLRSMGSKSELHWEELDDGDDSGVPPVIPEPPVLPDAKAALTPQGVLRSGTAQVWVMRRQIGAGATLVYEVGGNGVRQRPLPAAGC